MLELNKIIQGDWIKLAEQLDDESIDLIMTSPPYWGLRDYGTQNETIWDGDKNCEHEWVSEERWLHRGTTQSKISGDDSGHLNEKKTTDNFCIRCGDWKGQLGLEPTPQLYIKHLIDGFRILKKKLKKTGSFYLNLGDTYFGGNLCVGQPEGWESISTINKEKYNSEKFNEFIKNRNKMRSNWLQPKQLMLMPSRVAIALQEDGWILRNDIIWNKPNPMPSSVKDRLNTTYEHIFHFVKSLPKTNWLLDVPYNEKEEWTWLAALIDGEGCIGISRCKKTTNHDTFSVYLSVANACKELLNKCVEITRLGKVHTSKLGKNQLIYVWRVNNRYASTVIAEVYPYLIAKKEQARIVLKFQEGCKYRGGNKGYDYEKKKNLGPPSISEKEWNKKLELFELCKKANYDLDAIREPHKEGSFDRWQGEKKLSTEIKYVKDDSHSPQNTQTLRTLKAGECLNPLGKNPGDVFAPYSVQPRLKDIIEYRNLPDIKEFAEYINNKRKEIGYIIDDIENLWNNQAPHHWFNAESFPSKEDYLKLKKVLQLDDRYDKQMTEIFLKSSEKINNPNGKNPGDFVSINTQPFPAAHFATFPEEICIKPIKSSCPKEICSKCGFIRERIIESNYENTRPGNNVGKGKSGNQTDPNKSLHNSDISKYRQKITYETKGFTNCNCNTGFKPGIVLDPFAGSGTALLVAKKLKRNYLGFELSPEYIKIAEMRLRGCQGWQFKEAKNNKSLKDF